MNPMMSKTESSWPKISLVTAVYNGEKYLEETIRSILGQGYPNLEYILVDGGSTDGTVEIIRRYEKQVTCWFRQEGTGVYAALNQGFARSTGEIMGWLNSSDMLHVDGLFVVGSVFAALREVEWITGRPTGFGTNGMGVRIGEVPTGRGTDFWPVRIFLFSRSQPIGGADYGNAPAGR